MLKSTKKKKTEREAIGAIICTKTEKYIQCDNGNRMYGFVYQKCKSKVSTNDVLVAFNNKDPTKFYTRIKIIKNYPIAGSGYERNFSESATHLDLEPFLEINPEEGYASFPRPHSMANFRLGFPEYEEKFQIYNVPKTGLPLGKLNGKGEPITFNFPLIPQDTLFQSMIIAGVQGSGKTNFTKLLANTVNTRCDSSIVILDAEGEYTNFTKLEDMTSSTQEFFKENGLSDTKLEILKLSNDMFGASATLSVDGINPQDILQILPDLPTKSAEYLQTIAIRARETLAQRGEDITFRNLKAEIEEELQSTTVLNGVGGREIKQAISRALRSHNLDLFDQPNRTKLIPQNIFKPKTITIIDFHTLSIQQQRMVTLYLLLMLYKYKFQDKNKEPGVLLFVDEAEILFPKYPTNAEKDYVHRIEDMMQEPVKHGRKQQYGIVLITHLPSDISKGIVNLCNNKVAFRCSGARTWIRENFGKNYVAEIEYLPTGECRLNTVKTSWQMNVRLKVPPVCHKDDVLELN